MYEVINEKLKLESCSIGDLTLDIVNGMLKSWNDGSSISTLTVFYMPARDTIVLNRDHVNYDTYRTFTETYLSCDEHVRRKIRKRYENKEGSGISGIIEILDGAIKHRKDLKDIFMLRYQPVEEEDNTISFSLMNEIVKDTESHYFAMYKAFQYGVIQGKRLERRKKRQSATA